MKVKHLLLNLAQGLMQIVNLALSLIESGYLFHFLCYNLILKEVLIFIELMIYIV